MVDKGISQGKIGLEGCANRCDISQRIGLGPLECMYLFNQLLPGHLPFKDRREKVDSCLPELEISRVLSKLQTLCRDCLRPQLRLNRVTEVKRAESVSGCCDTG